MNGPFKLKYKNSSFPFKKEDDPIEDHPAILTDKEKAKLSEKFRDRDFIRERFNIEIQKRKNLESTKETSV